jgi:hypothetical protein
MAVKSKARFSPTKRGLAPTATPRFQRAIEAVETLPLAQREALVDVLTKRNRDARRREIETEIQESLKEYEQGKARSGSLDDLLKDLDT